MLSRAEVEPAAAPRTSHRPEPGRRTARTALAVAATVVCIALSAGCGGSAPPPASKNTGQAPAERSAPKAQSSPSTPKPSPTPDPAGRTEPVAGECPASHQLKGATSPTGEKLYYEPERPTYASVTPEICFTAGGDARANGYQESRR